MKDNGGQLRGRERVWGVGAAHVAESVECYDKFLWHRSARCYLSWVGSSGLLPASMSLLSLNLIIQEAWSALSRQELFSAGGRTEINQATSYLCPPGDGRWPGSPGTASALCAFSRYGGHSQEGYSEKMT